METFAAKVQVSFHLTNYFLGSRTNGNSNQPAPSGLAF